jgi:7,8-dihydropterin-6-yl-methyl-4-(beta-D-ribofuranosyl)aminobenzene 5'-phosphate synthase
VPIGKVDMRNCVSWKRAAPLLLGLIALFAAGCTRKLPDRVSLTVIYDNTEFDPRLQTEWGFSCWVQYGDTVLLFDTGGDGTILLSNMSALGLDPRDIDIVVLSHIHGDHTGGMNAILGTGVRPEVYVPLTFPTEYKNELRAQVAVHEVNEARQILPGVHTTGKMGLSIPEQGMVLQTCEGLVVITGCAHPGIDQMVQRAKEIGRGDIYLVVGGFHLGQASEARVRRICQAFRELGVQNVAPCHCTGDAAIATFESEFAQNCLPAGVGWGIGFCDLEEQ